MKNDESKELTLEIGGEADRLKVLKIVMNKMMSILDEMLSENEELMRKKQEDTVIVNRNYKTYYE
jgi:hypothetical protein